MPLTPGAFASSVMQPQEPYEIDVMDFIETDKNDNSKASDTSLLKFKREKRGAKLGAAGKDCCK